MLQGCNKEDILEDIHTVGAQQLMVLFSASVVQLLQGQYCPKLF